MPITETISTQPLLSQPADGRDVQPGKSLFTTVREFVENSLDAAESISVPPEISVLMYVPSEPCVSLVHSGARPVTRARTCTYIHTHTHTGTAARK